MIWVHQWLLGHKQKRVLVTYCDGSCYRTECSCGREFVT